MRLSGRRHSTHLHKKTLGQQQTHYENCQNLRDTPHIQLSLTSYPPVPRHRNILSQPTTRDQSYSVRSHPASSCERQPVLIDPSPFLDVSSLDGCASFVCDTGTISWRLSASFETSYAPQKCHDTLVTDFGRQTGTFLSGFGRLFFLRERQLSVC